VGVYLAGTKFCGRAEAIRAFTSLHTIFQVSHTHNGDDTLPRSLVAIDGVFAVSPPPLPQWYESNQHEEYSQTWFTVTW